MIMPSLRQLISAFFLGVFSLAFSGWAHADPPSRVARLAHITGVISFSPSGENDWVRATVKDDGMDLELRSLNPAHPEHGQKVSLAWG